ncbi:MAG: hypothetical protein RSA09_00160 [Acinetobacter sp.]
MRTLKLPRDVLAKFLPDQRSIIAFEKLFVDVDENQSTNIDLINEVSVSADNAGANAQLALALIDYLQALADLESTNPASLEDEPTQDAIPRVEPINYFDYIDFDSNNGNSLQVGRMFYNNANDTLNIAQKNNIVQQIGEEIFIQVTNNTGSTILNGSLVSLTGSGTTVALYNANGSVPPMYVLGIATQDIPNGARGRLTHFGRVNDVNTTGLSVGIVYANPAVVGGLTSVKPTAPDAVIPVGVVTSSAVNGQIFVRPILEQQRSFGAFAKTDSATLAAINTAAAITLNTTISSNGVSLSGTQVQVSQSGLYSFSVSFQLSSTNSSIKDVYLWFRKNGADLDNTTIIHSLESGTAKSVQSRTLNVSMNDGDYIELYWASPDTGVSLSAIAATAFSPAAPSVILNVNQVQQ